MELQEYRCHKIVRAGKIETISKMLDASKLGVINAEGKPEVVTVAQAWIKKHDPQLGGYFVEYEDGYSSYSPAEAFESGYTAIEPMDGPKYKKKPAIVQAFRYGYHEEPGWLLASVIEVERFGDYKIVIYNEYAKHEIKKGDWIIREPDGAGAYPCTHERFVALFDNAD